MSDLMARDVMNTEVLSVRPDLSVHALAAFLTERQISGAPVVDVHGRLMGVVSLTDIAESAPDRGDGPRVPPQPQRTRRPWDDDDDAGGSVTRVRLERADLAVRDIMTPV